MPKTTTRKTPDRRSAFTPPPLTRSDVKEVVEEIVRTAIGQQARELEGHLTNIHERILQLEKKR